MSCNAVTFNYNKRILLLLLFIILFHQDDESIFGDKPSIFSLSLGGDRDFILGPKECKDKIKNQICIKLESGTLINMAGNTQKQWYHKVPPKSVNMATRINATFRLTV